MVNIKDFYVLEDVYIALAVMSIFVSGLLLFRKVIKPPKGLIIASFISYILVLIIILDISFKLQIPKALVKPCFAVAMWPSYYITSWISGLFNYGPAYFLKEGWFDGSIWFIMHDNFWGDLVKNLVAFSINTLLIFAIIRLILHIKHKVSAKKTRAKQTE